MSKTKRNRKPKVKISGPLLLSPSEITEKDLTDDQRKAAKLFEKWYHDDKKGDKPILRVGGHSGSGKSNPVDMPIPTPDGMRRFGDLKIGDKVFNLYGEPVKVIGIYPQGVQPTYKVTFSDGRYTYCNKEHIWTTITSKGNFKDRTLGEMMGDYRKSKKYGYRYMIPAAPIVQYKERPVSVDPYVLGALIGNGCLTERVVTISSGNMDVPKEVGRILNAVTRIRHPKSYSYHYYYRLDQGASRTATRKKAVATADLFKDYPDFIGAKSGDKYIPDDYKYNSVKVRLDLLQGLLDTDGHVSEKKGRISYTTVSTRLKDDIVELVRSLGMWANATKDNRVEKYSTGVCWKIFISAPPEVKLTMFRVNYKSLRRICGYIMNKPKKTFSLNLRLTNIERVEDTEQMCIMVDDPDHIYIAQNFIPTHNTTLIKYLIDKMKFDAKDCYVLAYTGQAVNRLRKDGVMARTIHSTIMYTVDTQVLDQFGKPIYRRGIPLMRVTFKPVKSLPTSVKLIIVDEASFLPKKLEDTLLKYNIPILETGDPRQLPPVEGEQVFNEDNVDFVMTQVVRQHRDSELYDCINRIRTYKNIDTKRYHDEVLFLKQQPTLEDTFLRFIPFFKAADVVVVSTNKQRQVFTDMYRKYILRTKSPFPIEGERLICRQNNQQLMIDQYMLANGMQGYAKNGVGRSQVDSKANLYYLDFQPDVTEGIESPDRTYFSNLPCNIERTLMPFGTYRMDFKYADPGNHFEYAHALTAHLIQGSEYDTVLYVDSYNRDLDYLMRLRYVAASRAKKRLIYLMPYSPYGYPFDLSYIEETMARQWEAQNQYVTNRINEYLEGSKTRTMELPD